jgi:hypothetical protein
MRDGAPPATVSSTPVVAGFPAAIARAGLGAVDAGDGSSTVTFPAPGGSGIPEYVPFSTEPMTVSRSLLDQAAGYAQEAVSDAGAALREGATDAATNALPSAPSSGAGDADKQFEELYDRLKRELLIEQEQLGQLFHEP